MRTSIGIVFLTLVSLVLFSCSTIKVTDTGLTGNWNAVFTGELSGSGKLNIKNDGSFTSEEFQLRNNNDNTTANYKLSGTINASVITNGKFIKGSSTVGNFDGNFVGTGGAGTYNVSSGLEGAWTAAKD